MALGCEQAPASGNALDGIAKHMLLKLCVHLWVYVVEKVVDKRTREAGLAGREMRQGTRREQE
jgi:hypothetical protein